MFSSISKKTVSNQTRPRNRHLYQPVHVQYICMSEPILGQIINKGLYRHSLSVLDSSYGQELVWYKNRSTAIMKYMCITCSKYVNVSSLNRKIRLCGGFFIFLVRCYFMLILPFFFNLVTYSWYQFQFVDKKYTPNKY